MKTCLICGETCEGDALTCPKCGEGSWGDTRETAPSQPTQSEQKRGKR